MLTEKQSKEIRENLESSQNPLFFFDNDLDGLCSFLLFRRFIGRGNGVAIKSYPYLDETYIRKIKEFEPDGIFILDKPLVSEEFLEYSRERGIPVVWIDHHAIQNPKGISYYNPMANSPPGNEPVSYLCHQVVRQDMWISMIGCIDDFYLPDFLEKFRGEFPELIDNKKTTGEIKFETELGKLRKMLDFSMKDTTTNVVRMMKILSSTKSPYDIIKGEKPYERMWKRYEQIKEKYDALIKKAMKSKREKLIFFRYSGDMGLTRDLSDELVYKFPEGVVMVARVNEGKVKISLRIGDKVKRDARIMVENALREIRGTGGGHEKSCGVAIDSEDLDKFKEIIEKQI